MADLDKLKSVRSRAQASFTKRGHTLTKAGLLEPGELLSEWRSFKEDFSRVTDAGHEYAEALRESADETVRASAEQIDQKTSECADRFLEAKRATQEAFWNGFAEAAFFTQAKTTDTALTQAEEEELNPQRSFKDRRLRNMGLDREVAELGGMLEEWKDLIPASKAVALRARYGTLRKRALALSDKLAADEEDEGSGRQQGSVAGDSLADFVNNPALQSSPDKSIDVKLESNTNRGIPSMNTQPRLQGLYQGGLEQRPQISLERARLPTFSGDV